MIINNNLHLGFQTLVELYGCSADLIDNEKLVEKILLELTDIVELTVVNSVIHHFSPIGVSGVVVIEESHVAVHTWPEYNYVAIDFFTCNIQYDIKKGITFLKARFGAKRVEINEIKRGSMDTIQSIQSNKKQINKSI